MAISLYDASVGSYRQALGAMGGFLDKGLAHCRESGPDPEEVVSACVFPDMRPFRFQVQAVAGHARGGVEAIRSGMMSPPPAGGPEPDYAGLQALVAEAREAMERVTPEEIAEREGAEVAFRVPGREMTFTAEDFVLTFSLPNLYFHAATAYDILRAKGVPLGKPDFIGRPRLKG